MSAWWDHCANIVKQSYSINQNIGHEVGVDDEVHAYGPLRKTIEIRKVDCSERYNYGDVEEEDGLNERPSHDKVAARLENTWCGI